jgi:uncharacterized protein
LLETKEGIVLLIKISPKAAKNAIAGWENEELKVRVHAVPEKGKANDALIIFLAKTLGISLSQLTLVSGEKSRHKKVLVRGITKTALQEKIALLTRKDSSC